MLSSSATVGRVSFLNRLITAAPARPFSVAFNVKSKFESAYETKMNTLKGQPKKV